MKISVEESFSPIKIILETQVEADIVFAALRTPTAEKQKVLPFLRPVDCDRIVRDYEEVYRGIPRRN
jgi:hypothetical protein